MIRFQVSGHYFSAAIAGALLLCGAAIPSHAQGLASAARGLHGSTSPGRTARVVNESSCVRPAISPRMSPLALS